MHLFTLLHAADFSLEMFFVIIVMMLMLFDAIKVDEME